MIVIGDGNYLSIVSPDIHALNSPIRKHAVSEYN
jgi:hypothetical protein